MSVLNILRSNLETRFPILNNTPWSIDIGILDFECIRNHTREAFFMRIQNIRIQCIKNREHFRSLIESKYRFTPENLKYIVRLSFILPFTFFFKQRVESYCFLINYYSYYGIYEKYARS